MRDIAKDVAENVTVVPQVIARDVSEFRLLCDAVQAQGWTRIDLNMGCPFPMQVHAGRGCGLMRDEVELGGILKEMTQRSDVSFSLKMRLGISSPVECMALLPMINDVPLARVVMHPRVASQQYRGAVDIDSFSRFYEESVHPVAYNGDIRTSQDMRQIVEHFPRLESVMIGRGLLANPLLAEECNGSEFNRQKSISVLLSIHSDLLGEMENNLCGDKQILSHIIPFWTYVADGGLLDSRLYKRIKKSRNLYEYKSMLAEVR